MRNTHANGVRVRPPYEYGQRDCVKHDGCRNRVAENPPLRLTSADFHFAERQELFCHPASGTSKDAATALSRSSQPKQGWRISARICVAPAHTLSGFARRSRRAARNGVQRCATSPATALRKRTLVCAR